MAKITYVDKVALDTEIGVADANKFRSTDANEIKTSVNTLYDNGIIGETIYGGTVSSDLNTINKSGFYTCYTGTTGLSVEMIALAVSFHILHQNSNVGTGGAYQRAVAYLSTDSIIYERVKITNVWGNWINTTNSLKAPLAAPTFTGIVSLPNTTSIGTVSDVELSYLDGTTSNIQSQIGTLTTNTTPIDISSEFTSSFTKTAFKAFYYPINKKVEIIFNISSINTGTGWVVIANTINSLYFSTNDLYSRGYGSSNTDVGISVNTTGSINFNRAASQDLVSGIITYFVA